MYSREKKKRLIVSPALHCMTHEPLVQSQMGRYDQPYVSPVRIFHLQHLASPRHWADGGIVRRNSPQSRPSLLSGKHTLQGSSEMLTCSHYTLVHLRVEMIGLTILVLHLGLSGRGEKPRLQPRMAARNIAQLPIRQT